MPSAGPCSASEAAAVPHWCDAAVLTALVDDSGLLGQKLWDRLKTLPVIEGFPARPGAAGYVAEISRLPSGNTWPRRSGYGSSTYAAALDIFRRLTELDRDDTDWLAELGLAYYRFADVAQELGDPRAEHAYLSYEAAFERLTGMDPDNANWRWELAEARRRTGG